ncbi:sensor histidine kinase [Flexivirga oryzae]|uniref:Signal transduction histidine kinase n=1 Tax=Flexivirga oryzae TaxID=1794944 RepID=A0A839MZ78_9MICO|nr:sensor histidine kinase [Flexivirga oryzae]MBB2890457.1 signal transduction histidine kinase [Flexivirga oryzae]
MRMLDRLQFVNGLIAIAIFTLAPIPLGGLPDLALPLRIVYWSCVALIVAIFTLIAGTRIVFPRNARTWTIVGLFVVLCYLGAALGSTYGFSVMLLAVVTAVWANFVPLRVSALTILVLLPASTALMALVNSQASLMACTWYAVLTLIVDVFVLVGVEQTAVIERARQEAEQANQALREAQAQLREHSAAEERLRIARELHDVVGHQLAGLTLTLETARHLPPEEAASYLDSAQLASKELLAQVRSVVTELREAPPEAESLQALSSAWPGLQVHLSEADLATLLPAALQHATIRLVQESLTNAVRHGSASQAWVALEVSDGTFSVVVRDDGCGAVTAVEGNGLRGMRERFAAVGGSVVWRGVPGGGFVVQASAPMGENAASTEQPLKEQV